MASTSERNQSESDMDCDEIICDLSDTSDTEIYSYHDTDSEQNSEADEEIPNDDSEFYFGKDGVPKWKKTMWQKTQIRTRSTNIISQLPGPKSEAKSIESESDAFTKIIDIDMVQKIVDCTNAYISNIKEHFSRERDAKLTTVTEILALFGLLIMSGVKRAAHLTYKELWAVDGSGVEIVRAIMSQDCFLFLLRCLRFDDITTRKERKKLDKLAPIREFVEAFVYNCKKLYTPGEYNTIDEKLIPFRGSFSFGLHVRSLRWNLRFHLQAPMTLDIHTLNFDIYAGKRDEKESSDKGQAYDVVFRLLERSKLLDKGYHLICDNFYTSVEMANDLYKRHTHLTGTLRRNRKYLPEGIKVKRIGVGERIYRYKEPVMLLSWREKKSQTSPVLLLSTYAGASTQLEKTSSGKEKNLPEIVKHYNSGKGGVDLCDQMMNMYQDERKSLKWWRKVFISMIHRTLLNAYIIYRQNTDKPLDRYDFQKVLITELTKDYAKRKEIKYIKRPMSSTHSLERLPEKKERQCVVCTPKLGRKKRTRYQCISCDKGVRISNFEMAIFEEQRICIKFCFKLKKTATETHELIKEAFGDAALSCSRTFEWFTRFLKGREKVNDDQHTGRPRSLRCKENKLKIKLLIKSNRRISIKDLSSETGLSVGLCHQIVTEDLDMIRTSSKFVPRILTEEQKEVRMDVRKNMVEMTRTDPEWMQKIITGDETWVYQYDPETKRQSSQWIERGEPKPKKARFTKSKVKTLLVTIFDINGLVHHEFIPFRRTINQEVYLGIMRLLREAVRLKRPERWQNNDWILHVDNARPHTAHVVLQFLANHSTIQIPYPPYSPDLAPNDFFLYPKLKIKLKG
ncbi:hypothetical protein LAZ67_23000974, partial [Cordylochernes scorpioides]